MGLRLSVKPAIWIAGLLFVLTGVLPSGELHRPRSAYAATLTVANTNDSGAGSLRQAILNANAAAGFDEIVFTVSGVIPLMTPLPAAADAAGLKINGAGRSIVVDGQSTVRPFASSVGTLELANFTVLRGRTLGVDSGAGVSAEGPLALTNMVFDGNVSSNQGGAVSVATSLSVTGGSFTNNMATTGGGAIALKPSATLASISGSTFNGNQTTGGHGGALTMTGFLSNSSITGSTFTANRALGGGCCTSGGAVYNLGVMAVSSSTFNGNQAGGDAGGSAIGNASIGNAPMLTVTQSTFDGNSGAGPASGALRNDGGGTLTLIESTLKNTAGQAAIYNSGSTTLTRSSVHNNG